MMALFNEIGVGRYNRFLQKLLAMKGGPPSAQLSSEIQPIIQLFHGVENRYLEGWTRWGHLVTVAANAGFPGQYRLRNPPGSNVIAVIEKILVQNASGIAQQIFVGKQTFSVDFAISFSGASVLALDFRHGITVGTGYNLIPSASNTVAQQGNSLQAVSLAPNTSWDFIKRDNEELPILPGDSLSVSSATLNQIQGFHVMWRERFLEDSERVA